jgi:predicted TIM-barrel fold metal-dependent hydrolase
MAQLPGVLRVARRHPDVPILVDHCAYPDLSGGAGYPNARPLFDLADAANVHVKLSTMVFERARADGVAPSDFTGALVAAFGAERIMWASDLTVHQRSYAELVAEADEACGGLSDPERELVLGTSAARLWWPTR